LGLGGRAPFENPTTPILAVNLGAFEIVLQLVRVEVVSEPYRNGVRASDGGSGIDVDAGTDPIREESPVLLALGGAWRRANGPRLSCGALKKDSFLNLRAPSASSAC
jgi:hypothetical protein